MRIQVIAKCAVYIRSAGRLTRLCDISAIPADIDYLNIHESGTITGRRNVDTIIFKEGEKFFIADNTADRASRITFPLAAGGGLIIALAVYALVRSRSKASDETEESPNEADKYRA